LENTVTTLQKTYRAKHRYARITQRKARLIADLIRGRSANEAFELLEFAPQRAAAFYIKVLKSAVANAAQDEGVDLNRLVVVDSRADDGPLLNNRMRWRAGPQGRAMPFAKKTSHLTVVVAVEGGAPAEEPKAKRKAKRKAKPAAEPAVEPAASNSPDDASGAPPSSDEQES